MVDRTRVYRGKGDKIGSNSSSKMEGRDPEVFDDTDFYQQLLRDVIDARDGGSGSQDWIRAQKERKKKKAVDTRASKGRKIRFLPLSSRLCWIVGLKPVTTGMMFKKNSKTLWYPSP
jgi:protein AATF/BFR2